MTKVRPPLSFAQAITRIAGLIGWDAAAAAVGRRERLLRAWSEPDHDACPTLAQALALDAAYAAAGGDGAPLLDAYAVQLDIRVEREQAATWRSPRPRPSPSASAATPSPPRSP